MAPPTTRRAYPDRLPAFACPRVGEGPPLTPEALRGRAAALVFGSYSSPSFRASAPGVAALAKELGRAAHVVVLYTAEAHPFDAPPPATQPERNRLDGVAEDAHADLAQRLRAAESARRTLALDEVPFYAEPLDGEPPSRAFDAFPAGAVVADGGGRVVLRQSWLSVADVRAALRKQRRP